MNEENRLGGRAIDRGPILCSLGVDPPAKSCFTGIIRSKGRDNASSRRLLEAPKVVLSTNVRPPTSPSKAGRIERSRTVVFLFPNINKGLRGPTVHFNLLSLRIFLITRFLFSYRKCERYAWFPKSMEQFPLKMTWIDKRRKTRCRLENNESSNILECDFLNCESCF